ncbi:MAG: hypothetical protein PHR77_14330, partial [Kiritimatiellae bacterium]|nr:hypothetical protein [Kiritimatiellia bacterium]
MIFMSIQHRFRFLVVVLGIITLFSHSTTTHAETIWIRADDTTSLTGPIELGQKTGIVEEGALGDFLVPTICVSSEKITGGYAEYQVKIPRTATYYVWARLRYPSGQDESFAIIPDNEKATTNINRCLGKSGIGVDKWHWDSQGTGIKCAPGKGRLSLSLKEGDLHFRIYAREAGESVFRPGRWTMARPIFMPRLNLICLTTDAAYVPTDTDACEALGVKETPVRWKDYRVKSMILPKVSTQQWQKTGKRPIPDWMRCPRFYTKDSWRSELETRKPGDIAFMVRQIAANEGSAFRLGGYWGGIAFFQSKVTPHAPGLGKIDYLREAVDEGDKLGVKIILYINPNALFTDHPLVHEVAVRRANGEESPLLSYGIPETRYVCINHPRYRDFLVQLLTEAFTLYNLAGLYVDGLTPHRCCCQYCREKYQKIWNTPMPTEKVDNGTDFCVLWEMVNRPIIVGNPEDPDSQRYTEFLNRSLTEVTQLINETVKQRKPEAVIIFHSWPKPDTIRFYDGTLTEIYVNKPWSHKLWKFGELANYSNIFPVPVLFNIYLHDHGTAAEARTKMFQGLANGCYPNCWNELSMKPVFRFMRENAEVFDFALTDPTRFLALPRAIHDDSVHSQIKSQYKQAKPSGDRFLAPYVGFYSAVARQGFPVVTLQRSNFHRQLAGFKVLCLANEASLSDEQIESIRKFVKDGGGLIATHETSLYDEKGRRREDFGLADV